MLIFVEEARQEQALNPTHIRISSRSSIIIPIPIPIIIVIVIVIVIIIIAFVVVIIIMPTRELLTGEFFRLIMWKFK